MPANRCSAFAFLALGFLFLTGACVNLTPPDGLMNPAGGQGAGGGVGGTTGVAGGATAGGTGGVHTGGVSSIGAGGSGGASSIDTGGSGDASSIDTGGAGGASSIDTGGSGGASTGGRGGTTTGGAGGASTGGRGGTMTGGTTATGGSASAGDAGVPPDVRPVNDVAPQADVTRPPDPPMDGPAVPDVPQVPDLPSDGPAVIPGLVLYYSCDQINGTTLPDMSGNGNNGTLVGPVAVGAGKVGSGALVFTATNDVDAAASGGYVAMPAGILYTSTNMTIATWFKINSNLQYQRIFDIGGVDGTGAATASMYLTPNGNTGHLQFTIRTAQPDGGTFTREDITDGTPTGTPTTMSTGVWWHVAVVLDSAGGHLYLNGNQVGSTTPITMRPPSLGNTPNDWIGRSEFVANPYLDGAIDEFRIYNRALTATEISALYTYAGH